jgi:predicted nucleotide-binding protein (sugar kinase/HSP70/actin superfamily)
MYRIRPYEVNKGETDIAVEECRQIIEKALENNTSLLKAAWQCRKRLKPIAVDRTQVKPKVSIIGEFWAMTTEGDGNYKLQAFLESEGAEVDVQFITAWMLYLIWQARYDTLNRSSLKTADEGRRSLQGVNVLKKRATLWAAKKVLMAGFQTFANIMGLSGYKFMDMEHMAKISQQFYDNDIRGGEGHMEVGKLILNSQLNKVNMTLSVKPFGCMPSSGVSDGVQSKITERYPEAIFLPIETTGDGAVNVYSRIQMQLFKARQQAQKEVDKALDSVGLNADKLKRAWRNNSKINHALHHSPHKAACTSADMIYELGKQAN